MLTPDGVLQNILEYDYRFYSINGNQRRQLWMNYFLDYLEWNVEGSFYVFFDRATFRLRIGKSCRVLYIKEKKGWVFTKTNPDTKHMYTIFFMFLSFFPLSSKQKKKQIPDKTIFQDDHHPTFIPQNKNHPDWIHCIMGYFFYKIIPSSARQIYPKESTEKKWLEQMTWSRKTFQIKSTDIILIRSYDFILHVFFKGGGHFLWTIERTEYNLDLLLLFLYKMKPLSFLDLFFPSVSSSYKTFDFPVCLDRFCQMRIF